MRLPANFNIKTVEGLAQTAYLVFYRDNSEEPFPLDGISLRGSIAQGSDVSVPMEFEITGENTATMSWPQMKAGSCRYDVFMGISENNEVPLFGGIFTFVKRVTPWLEDEVATPEFARRIFIPSAENGKICIKCCDCDLIKALVAQAEDAKNKANEAADRAESAAEEIESIGIENIAKVNAPNNFSVKQELDAGANVNADSLFTGIHTFERMGGDGYLYRCTIGGANGARRTIVFEQINPDTGAFANRTVLDAGFVTTNQLYLNLTSTASNAAVRYDQLQTLLQDKAGLSISNDFTGEVNSFNKILVSEIGARPVPVTRAAGDSFRVTAQVLMDEHMIFSPQMGIFGTEEGTGRQFTVATLRTYNAGTTNQLTQLELGSEQDHTNINSVDTPTWESPTGKKAFAFADQLEEKANTSNLGTAAYQDIGSDGDWSEKVVTTDINGLIPPELLPPNAGTIVIDTAETIDEIVADINSRTGIIEGTNIEVIAGTAKGEYIVNTTKPDGTYTADDIDAKASFSGVETITLNGDEYIPVNGNVNLGSVTVAGDLARFLTISSAQSEYATQKNLFELESQTNIALSTKADKTDLDNYATVDNLYQLAVAADSKLEEKVPINGDVTTTGLKKFTSIAVVDGNDTLLACTSTGGRLFRANAPTEFYDAVTLNSAPTLPLHAVRLVDLTGFVQNGEAANLTSLSVTTTFTSSGATYLTGDTYVTGAIHLGGEALEPVTFHGKATIAEDGSLKIVNSPVEPEDVTNKDYVDKILANYMEVDITLTESQYQALSDEEKKSKIYITL